MAHRGYSIVGTVFVVAFALSSCNGPSAGHADGAARDSGPDAASQETDSDAASQETGSDAAPPCPVSIATYCGASVREGCTPAWSAVLADTTICSNPQVREEEMDSACAPYEIRQITYVDSGTRSYYDSSSGALVAIWSFGLFSGNNCLAGPANLSQPSTTCDAGSDSGSTRWRTCVDAGADASAQ